VGGSGLAFGCGWGLRDQALRPVMTNAGVPGIRCGPSGSARANDVHSCLASSRSIDWPATKVRKYRCSTIWSGRGTRLSSRSQPPTPTTSVASTPTSKWSRSDHRRVAGLHRRHRQRHPPGRPGPTRPSGSSRSADPGRRRQPDRRFGVVAVDIRGAPTASLRSPGPTSPHRSAPPRLRFPGERFLGIMAGCKTGPH
jgi:hypothetical protein